MYAKLIDGKVVPCGLIAWGLWLEHHTEDRIVGRTEYMGALVSTVFLGIDHGWGGKPMWFETMIFDTPWAEDEIQWRCTTYKEALDQHEIAVAYLETRWLLEIGEKLPWYRRIKERLRWWWRVLRNKPIKKELINDRNKPQDRKA